MPIILAPKFEHDALSLRMQARGYMEDEEAALVLNSTRGYLLGLARAGSLMPEVIHGRTFYPEWAIDLLRRGGCPSDVYRAYEEQERISMGLPAQKPPETPREAARPNVRRDRLSEYLRELGTGG